VNKNYLPFTEQDIIDRVTAKSKYGKATIAFVLRQNLKFINEAVQDDITTEINFAHFKLLLKEDIIRKFTHGLKVKRTLLMPIYKEELDHLKIVKSKLSNIPEDRKVKIMAKKSRGNYHRRYIESIKGKEGTFADVQEKMEKTFEYNKIETKKDDKWKR
jgi:hypothetical protein